MEEKKVEPIKYIPRESKMIPMTPERKRTWEIEATFDTSKQVVEHWRSFQ